MTTLSSEIEGLILSAIASFVTLWIGHKKGFFLSLKQEPKAEYPPTLLLVMIAFGIYFTLGVLAPLLLDRLFFFYSLDLMSERIAKLTWITFLTSSLTAAGLFILCRSIYRPIWEGIRRRNKGTYKQDLFIAFIACLIALPLVLFIGQLLEIILYLIFSTFELPDQIVVIFLKMTFSQPLYFFFATLSIILFAPIIEEILFRGFLQNYLLRYCSSTLAILLSSALFAVFHFSKDQGLANIPILGSLFVLAYFLGFVYQRQGSLAAPIFLHAAFNAINTVNLYISGA